jgi:hypothetical protein
MLNIRSWMSVAAESPTNPPIYRYRGAHRWLWDAVSDNIWYRFDDGWKLHSKQYTLHEREVYALKELLLTLRSIMGYGDD